MADTGLSGIAIASRSIKVPGGDTFAVRGLSLSDLTALYHGHSGDMGLWFERFIGGSDDSGTAMGDAIASIIASAPNLAARAIALGAGDSSDDGAAAAGGFPLGTQIEALSAIGDLTFTEDMPPKKVFEIVSKMAVSLVGPSSDPGTA